MAGNGEEAQRSRNFVKAQTGKAWAYALGGGQLLVSTAATSSQARL